MPTCAAALVSPETSEMSKLMVLKLGSPDQVVAQQSVLCQDLQIVEFKCCRDFWEALDKDI